MTRLHVALLNMKDGAQVARGRYDFDRLRRAFATVEHEPEVVQYCEATHYRDHAGEAKYAGRRGVVGRVGRAVRGGAGIDDPRPLPPAIFCDPNRLILRRWWQHDDPGAFDNQHARAANTPDGTWSADTRAVDQLIGGWDTSLARRVDGAGFHHIAELDPQAPSPLPPTVNGGNGLHIDHILANKALLATADVVPGSYQVHIPTSTNPVDWPSDHRRVRLAERFSPPAASSPLVRGVAEVPRPPDRVLVRPYNASRYAGWLPPSCPVGQHRGAP
jgi:hypothetical protein